MPCCADPLIMENGMDLIDMMCNCYESPQDASEDVPHYNFSTISQESCSSLMHVSDCKISQFQEKARIAITSVPVV